MTEDQNCTGTTIMTALSTLTPLQFSDLTNSISSVFHRQHHCLSSLLSSPTLFSLTLRHLHSLSLHQKSLLIARHLLTILTHLTHRFTGPPLSCATTAMKPRDLNAVLLLLLLCELHQHDPGALKTPPSNWRPVLARYVSDSMLKLSGIGASNYEILTKYIEMVTKCRRFVSLMGCGSGGGGKEGREVAASVAVVVALPSVELSGCGTECVICKEETREGGDVCELPCGHLFHWTCILPWLRKRNTCPCCRYRLPTDDVIAEIQWLWEFLLKMGTGSKSYGENVV